jgi:ribosome biogenesis GTPase A
MVKKGKASHSNKLTRQGLTVSIVPGTTLDFLKIDLGGPKLFDTPGLILPHQITSHLNPKELKVCQPPNDGLGLFLD